MGEPVLAAELVPLLGALWLQLTSHVEEVARILSANLAGGAQHEPRSIALDAGGLGGWI
jgi:hypothetical protein